MTQHKKWIFPHKISLVNVNKLHSYIKIYLYLLKRKCCFCLMTLKKSQMNFLTQALSSLGKTIYKNGRKWASTKKLIRKGQGSDWQKQSSGDVLKKKVFLKISQNWQENTFVRVFYRNFLFWVRMSRALGIFKTYLKRRTFKWD